MNDFISKPVVFQELRQKLAEELMSIGRNNLVCKRTISMSEMAQMMGISKETVFTLLESLEQRDDITIDRQRIRIKRKSE